MVLDRWRSRWLLEREVQGGYPWSVLGRDKVRAAQDDAIQWVRNRIRLVRIQPIHIGAVGQRVEDRHAGRGIRIRRRRLTGHRAQVAGAGNRLRVQLVVGRRTEVAQFIAQVVGLTEVAVANAQVHRQPPRCSPVVLSIQFDHVLIDVCNRRLARLREAIRIAASSRIADQEVRELGIERTGRNHARAKRGQLGGRRRRRGGKGVTALVVGAGGALLRLVVVVRQAELQRVLPFDLRDTAKCVVIHTAVVIKAVAGDVRPIDPRKRERRNHANRSGVRKRRSDGGVCHGSDRSADDLA